MKDKNKNNKDFIDYDYLYSAATSDCTGLMPTPTKNKAEEESYEELYPFLPKNPTKEDDEEWVD